MCPCIERLVLAQQDTTAPAKRTEKIKSRVDPDAAKAQRHGNTTYPLGTPNNPCNKILTIANIITFCRFLLTIAFIFLFVVYRDRTLALICYAVAASTDFLDGMVARGTQTVSWLGKIMDPIMDRFLLVSGVLGLVLTGELPVWIAVFVIGRDVYLSLGGLVLQHYRHRPIDVIFLGKLTTALFLVGFSDLLLGLPVIPGFGLFDISWLPGFGTQSVVLGIWFIYVAVITSTITAIIYTREAVYFILEAKAGHDVESVESNERAREALHL